MFTNLRPKCTVHSTILHLPHHTQQKETTEGPGNHQMTAASHHNIITVTVTITGALQIRRTCINTLMVQTLEQGQGPETHWGNLIWLGLSID